MLVDFDRSSCTQKRKAFSCCPLGPYIPVEVIVVLYDGVEAVSERPEEEENDRYSPLEKESDPVPSQLPAVLSEEGLLCQLCHSLLSSSSTLHPDVESFDHEGVAGFFRKQRGIGRNCGTGSFPVERRNRGKGDSRRSEGGQVFVGGRIV